MPETVTKEEVTIDSNDPVDEPFTTLSLEDQRKFDKEVLWGLDCRLIPTVGILYLCSFLDRTNVGFAKVIGLEKDLHLTNLKFEQGLTVFYLAYIIGELPSNLIIKKATPKLWLPLLTFAWGAVVLALGFVKNFADFVAVRFLLGLTEGGLFPGILLYLASMYRREDLALRIGLFFTGAGLAGAFGGLLGRGLSAIGPRGGLAGWRWIMIIEGLITMAAAIIAYLLLPPSLEQAKFLRPDQRKWAIRRLIDPTLGIGKVSEFTPKDESKEEFSWSEVRRGLFDISTWIVSVGTFGATAALFSYSLFLPTIVQEMNITKSPSKVQLYAVIPFAIATPLSIVVVLLSDRYQLRGTLSLYTIVPSIIGYGLIPRISNSHAKFGMTILMAMGLFTTVPCVLVWVSNNNAGHYKRAAATSIQIVVGNCSGFLATFVYPQKQAPRFLQGHTIIFGLLILSWVIDKEKGKYDKYIGYGDDRDPLFKMVL